MADSQVFDPIDGVCFWCEPMPAARLSVLLCEIAAFLQDNDPHAAITRVEDWLEHDGRFVREGPTDLAAVFESVGSPRDLLRATPEDEDVYRGFVDVARRWYLRFRIVWDEAGVNLAGDFALALVDELAEQFSNRFEHHALRHELAFAYFGRITV